jgi:hypothetical protein
MVLGVRDGAISIDVRTRETISRMSEVIAAQILPVCLVVTGDDLGKTSFQCNPIVSYICET